MPRRCHTVFCVTLCLALGGCSRGSRDVLRPVVGTQARAGWMNYTIGKSAVNVTVPSDYTAAEEPNETLVLTLPGDSGVKLRFNDHTYLNVPAINGDAFVRAQAQNKNLPVTQRKGKVYFTETKTWGENDDKALAHYWFVGFDDRYVVMSATMYDKQKDTPDVKRCLEKTIPQMIESLKK